MILVNDIMGWVFGKLDISRKVTQISTDTFLRDVDDGVMLISRKYPTLRKIQTFTTTAGSGLFTLDAEVRPLKILDISHQWKHPIKFIQTQQMREFRQALASSTVNFPYANQTDQPSYWAYYSNIGGDLGDPESPGANVLIEDASKIIAGLAVTIEYSYIPRILKVSRLGMTVDMGEEYKLLLCAYVAWQQAIRYSDQIGNDKINAMKELYFLEIQQIQTDHRKSLQSNEIENTEIIPY
jgi:hypothetical protein